MRKKMASVVAACLLALVGCAQDVEGAGTGGGGPALAGASAGAGGVDPLEGAEGRLDLAEGELQGADEGEVGVADQALWHTWSQTRSVRIVGIARAYNTRFAYIWYADGKVCNTGSSDGNDFCGSPLVNFSAPDSPANIAAIGIATDTGQVYTWYNDSTVSRGKSTNLDYHNGKRTFYRPVNPDTGALFYMDQLIDADCSNNLDTYYYWLSDTGRVWRTIGDSRDSDKHSRAKSVVVVPEFMPIRGISFSNRIDINAPIETWYSRGHKNFSGSSLNLME